MQPTVEGPWSTSKGHTGWEELISTPEKGYQRRGVKNRWQVGVSSWWDVWAGQSACNETWWLEFSHMVEGDNWLLQTALCCPHLARVRAHIHTHVIIIIINPTKMCLCYFHWKKWHLPKDQQEGECCCFWISRTWGFHADRIASSDLVMSLVLSRKSKEAGWRGASWQVD